MVDARLIENQNRLLLTYLPTKVSECAICTWNTHISLLSHVFASKCRDVQSFCGNGRNHAVHSKDLGISSIEPRVSFWHNRVWRHHAHVWNKTCPNRLSLTTGLLQFDPDVYIGIGHVHREKGKYTRFGSRYTHFFFLWNPVALWFQHGREWCFSSNGMSCSESVQFCSGFTESYQKDEYIITYGARDCFSRAVHVNRDEILTMM
jgi:hypothetical protein